MQFAWMLMSFLFEKLEEKEVKNISVGNATMTVEMPDGSVYLITCEELQGNEVFEYMASRKVIR